MPSLEMIARRSGVSRATAATVLRGEWTPTRPSAIRRAQRIRRVAEQLGYRPNAAAKAMSTGRFGTIALVQSTNLQRSAVPLQLLNGLSSAMTERDLNLLVPMLPDRDLVSEDYLPQFLRQRMCDGLIINYTDHIPELLRTRMREDSIPSIWINTRQPFNCVYPDDEQASHALTCAILGVGHRHVAYLDFSHRRGDETVHYSSIDREVGYSRAMREAGLEPEVVRADGVLPGEQRVAASMQWLEGTRATAVVCYGGSNGISVAMAAARRGMTLPDDLIIASHDNSPETSAGVRFPTAIVPQSTMARIAVELLLQRIDDPTLMLPPHPVPFELDLVGLKPAATDVRQT